MKRPAGLDFRRSLRAVLPDEDDSRIADIASRQERTVDALLQRMYDEDLSERREIALLADEVGLGKTFVALGVAWSVLQQRRKHQLAKGPVLIVTPQSRALYQKWHREAEVFRERVAKRGMGFEIRRAETPQQLAEALRTRKPAVVIARMHAISGRLHHLDVARRAALHSLLRMEDFRLSVDDRQDLVYDWEPAHGMSESLNLRGSGGAWAAAQAHLGFGKPHLRGAWKRLGRLDPRLRDNLYDSWERVREGRSRRVSFWADLREYSRAALGQSIPHHLPLVIVDEIHNWKNHPQSWKRFLYMLGGRVDRLLGLSATPFQLGPEELIRVLALRSCLSLDHEREEFLSARVAELERDLRGAGAAGEHFRSTWGEVREEDSADVANAWTARTRGGTTLDGQPPRVVRAIAAGLTVREAHERLMTSLRPFLIRHRRSVSHRSWWVGRESAPGVALPSACGAALRWRPGLDVEGDAELIHYLMMSAVQEQKGGRGATSLGADLGGSYSYFREGELKRQSPGSTEAARRYLDLVRRATDGDGTHEHPKVHVTAERAFRAWLRGEKTLVFCFNVKTTQAVQEAITERIQAEQSAVLTKAFSCSTRALDRRLANFQRRLYDYRQSIFLLFQDHPLAGPDGRLPRRLSLRSPDVNQICARLAEAGPPRSRSRFDRRRLIAATEQVLVTRWMGSSKGTKWLDDLERYWKPKSGLPETVLASNWIEVRRGMVEGVMSSEDEVEPLAEIEEATSRQHAASSDHTAAWRTVLESKPGQAALAPYLGDHNLKIPSLLSTYHAATLNQLPARLRALAARMLRRMIRMPGFLARFLLQETADRPDVTRDPGRLTEDWTALIHKRYQSAPLGGESARDRFEAYLDNLKKSADLQEQVAAYEDASRNRDVVARVTGGVAGAERDRFFTGFNTPLVPEVLIVTTVGQEGIDLHRECSHVVHHDLPWNPATLEQRTGRVDRIGSKAERLRSTGVASDSPLDIAVPYIAGTYDEHRFRVVHGRAHLFEVTMGGEYAVDGHREARDPMDANAFDDDEGSGGTTWAALPEVMAEDLRLRLDTGPVRKLGAKRRR